MQEWYNSFGVSDRKLYLNTMQEWYNSFGVPDRKLYLYTMQEWYDISGLIILVNYAGMV